MGARHSLRGRFLLGACALAIALAAVMLYAAHLARSANQESLQAVRGYYASHQVLRDTGAQLEQLEGRLYDHLVGGEAPPGGETHAFITQVGRLRADPVVGTLPHFAGLTEALADLADRIAHEQAGLLGSDGTRSERWAGFREHIHPLLSGARQMLQLMERRLSDAVLDNTFHAMDVSGALSRFILGITLVVILVMAAHYMLFELAIRRPILRVARALAAEGAGEQGTWLPEVRIGEIGMLVDAFNAMRAQIHSRQNRLESVLNNTSDGIITVSERGEIEAFNAAAQRLFGYREDEIAGTPLAALFETPGWPGDAPFGPAVEASLGREMEVLGVRRDGTRTAMAVKLTRFHNEDRTLYNALVADISARRALIERLTFLAERDPLTGLHNRRHFYEELSRVVERARRSAQTGHALLYIDLDRFKAVNDTLGHQAGDQLLVEITGRLRERARHGDLLARLGGDEFAVLLYGVDRRGCEQVAESYRGQLADYAFHYHGQAVDVACSIGAAMLEPRVGDSEEFIRRADLACRTAKRQGRNRAHLYQPDDVRDVARSQEEIGWARRLRCAMAENRLFLVYQDIACGAPARCSMREALLRLRDEEGRIQGPDTFLEATERLGLAPALDCWVIEHLLGELATLDRLTSGTPSYTINLSGHSLTSSEVLETIEREIVRHAIDPARLIFEVTETAAIVNLAEARRFIDTLARLGCRTALDDFGSGYSSFIYLRELPVDFVKIDGAFVRGIEHDPLNLAIIRAMNDIAHTLGKRTIAEFVETAGQLALLHEMGVDCFQGYHIGMPQALPKHVEAVAGQRLAPSSH